MVKPSPGNDGLVPGTSVETMRPSVVRIVTAPQFRSTRTRSEAVSKPTTRPRRTGSTGTRAVRASGSTDQDASSGRVSVADTRTRITSWSSAAT